MFPFGTTVVTFRLRDRSGHWRRVSGRGDPYAYVRRALVTTAAGLFTAIPAVIFYNSFVGDIRDLAQRLDTFALEVTAQVEKTFS